MSEIEQLRIKVQELEQSRGQKIEALGQALDKQTQLEQQIHSLTEQLEEANRERDGYQMALEEMRERK